MRLPLLLCASLVLIGAQAFAENGNYFPIHKEIGFTSDGGYFDAGFQATVNRFSGNLLVSQTDISISSIGGFGLFFGRTYNSNSAYDAEFQRPFISRDGPLGQGWTGHYGLLFIGNGPSVWVDPSGGREIFYRHDHLNIPITGDGNESWISKSLKILVRKGNDYYIYTPDGLTYKLVSQAETRIRKPVEVRDVHGNTWDIVYESDSDSQYLYQDIDHGLVNHPLVKSVTDDWGRRLNFTYQTINGRKRLSRIQLGNQRLATYSYETAGEHTFLKTHTTGAGRQTTYTTDKTGEGKGTITAIEMDTGGVMSFSHGVRQFHYRTGAPATKVYAVIGHQHGGGSWAYTYPSQASSVGAFTVGVNGPEGFSGVYTYHT